jgi:hypothetical protein
MAKTSLYCIPHNRAIKRNKNGIVYQCEIDADAAAANDGAAGRSPVSTKCKVCNMSFKDERCLKIHKTKKGHWGNSIKDPDEGPKRPTKQHKDIGANVANRKKRTKPNMSPSSPVQTKKTHYAQP